LNGAGVTVDLIDAKNDNVGTVDALTGNMETK
jgi:hypothetical protein